MHCSSHFEGQKWNRVIDLSWNDTTLLFTYSRWTSASTSTCQIVSKHYNKVAKYNGMKSYLVLIHLSAKSKVNENMNASLKRMPTYWAKLKRNFVSNVVTDQTFGSAELFVRTSTVRFGPNDRTFFYRTQNFFFVLHSMPIFLFYLMNHMLSMVVR